MRAKVKAVAVIVVVVLSAGRVDAQVPSQDSIRGRQATSVEDLIVGQRIRVPSSSFGTERTFLVHLPDGYAASDDRYPLLVVVGGDYFVPAAAMAVYLAGDGRMPEAIVAAVPIEDWAGEFTYTEARDTAAFYATSGGADRLQRFLSEEVIPYLDARYRTHPLRILVGHSLGGLFAVETMTRYPDLFQVTIAISPSLFYNDGEWVDGLPAFLRERHSGSQVLYLALASETTTTPYMQRAVEILEDRAPRRLTHAFQAFPEESHVSVAVPALFQGLKSAFSGWSFGNVEMWTVGADGIRSHYDSLSTRFGVRIPLPREEIIAHGFHAMERHQDIDAAIDMFLLALSLDDVSAEAHVGLAEAYRQKGMSRRAIEHCHRALAIDPANERAQRLLAQLRERPAVLPSSWERRTVTPYG